MNMADASDSLKSSLLDMAEVFTDPLGFSFVEMITIAVRDLHLVKPFRKHGSITLVAGQVEYDAPIDYLSFGSSSWGLDQRRGSSPWESDYPKSLPILSAMDVAGVKKLFLSFAPNGNDISTLGTDYSFSYFAKYSAIDDVAEEKLNSIFLRAQAEAFLAMNARTAHRQASPSQPGAARSTDFLQKYRSLMSEWKSAA